MKIKFDIKLSHTYNTIIKYNKTHSIRNFVPTDDLRLLFTHIIEGINSSNLGTQIDKRHFPLCLCLLRLSAAEHLYSTILIGGNTK